MDVVVMYRPVNGAELALVQASVFKKWPARLPEQPIFYPVTNEKYACEIAGRWNVKDFGEGYASHANDACNATRGYALDSSSADVA